jgi:hypothetical protein
MEEFDIVTQGAIARANGLTLADSPYLKSDQLPEATGDPAWMWQARRDAWEAGWKLEDAAKAGG